MEGKLRAGDNGESGLGAGNHPGRPETNHPSQGWPGTSLQPTSIHHHHHHHHHHNHCHHHHYHNHRHKANASPRPVQPNFDFTSFIKVLNDLADWLGGLIWDNLK